MVSDGRFSESHTDYQTELSKSSKSVSRQNILKYFFSFHMPQDFPIANYIGLFIVNLLVDEWSLSLSDGYSNLVLGRKLEFSQGYFAI